MITGALKSPDELRADPADLLPRRSRTSTSTPRRGTCSISASSCGTRSSTRPAPGCSSSAFDVTAAYALSKLRPVFGKVVLGLMLATLMIPAEVILLPAYLTVPDLPILGWNLLNTPWAIWLPAVANGFNIFLLKRFFDSIPRDLLEAAEIDGAGPLRILWSIVLPMSRPILGVVSIFAVVTVWKDFLWPLLVCPTPTSSPSAWHRLSCRTSMPQNVLIAALVIASIPTIVMFLVFQRHIIAGLSAGQHQGLTGATPYIEGTPTVRSSPACPRRGGAAPRSTRSTCAASPTATATASATSPASAARLPYLADSASTRSGSTRGTSRRWPTAATTSPTTATSTRSSAPSPRRRSSSRRPTTLGIRTIIDIVPNHVSDQHPWFRAALAGRPGSPERERFWFRPGRGEHGELPPNDWPSHFGGPRLDPASPDGEWYLHLFAPEQPDLNWDHPTSAQEFEDVLRFWFDRGVDGVRIDSAALLDQGPGAARLRRRTRPGTPIIDRDERARHLPRLAARSPTSTTSASSSARSGCPTPSASPATCAPTSCTPRSTSTSWPARGSRAGCATSIDTTLAAHAPVGAPATWVLCNHDVTRTVTRYGRADTGFDFASQGHGTPTDLELGTRRARAAALLTLALPGAVYVYQGEELGLPEVEDIPRDRSRTRCTCRSGGTDPGRDGCRVPLPWSGDAPPFGFSPPAQPWLPQPGRLGVVRRRPAGRGPRVDAQSLPRRASGSGRSSATARSLGCPRPRAFSPSPVRAVPVCVVNLAGAPVDLPEHTALLLASGRLDAAGRLPTDTAVWLRS